MEGYDKGEDVERIPITKLQNDSGSTSDDEGESERESERGDIVSSLFHHYHDLIPPG